jgi:hypothetical protein
MKICTRKYFISTAHAWDYQLIFQPRRGWSAVLLRPGRLSHDDVRQQVGRKSHEVGGAVPAKFIEYLVAASEDEDDDILLHLKIIFRCPAEGKCLTSLFFEGGGGCHDKGPGYPFKRYFQIKCESSQPFSLHNLQGRSILKTKENK